MPKIPEGGAPSGNWRRYTQGASRPGKRAKSVAWYALIAVRPVTMWSVATIRGEIRRTHACFEFLRPASRMVCQTRSRWQLSGFV